MVKVDGQHPSTALERANATAQWLLDHITTRPRVALQLGSGLGAFADALEDAVRFPFTDIPGFVATTVPGHKGELVVGRCGGVDVVVMSGRFHYYEHQDMELVALAVRMLRQMGVRYLLVTNSSGGVNPSFRPGDLMIIDDHINLTGRNPLLGANEDAFGPRFPDMTYAYDPRIRACMNEAAESIGADVKHGVYLGLLGPSYETPAEVRMLRMLGGDAVGMSTVPEVLVANHCGMVVGGISCIANQAAGLTDQRLSHDEIKDAADHARDNFIALLNGTIARMAAHDDLEWSALDGALDAAKEA